MEISPELKKAFLSDNKKKKFHLNIANVDNITNERIVAKTLKLKESLVSGNKFEIVGCISSQFEVVVYDTVDNLKGKNITAWMEVNNVEGPSSVLLFHGIIDSAVKQNDRRFTKIVAYDELYSKANVDVSLWFAHETYPIKLSSFRRSLLNHLKISDVYQVDLPNDDLLFDGSSFKFESLNGLAVLKSICQIQGGFGIIGRNGLFEIRIVNAISHSLGYPSLTTFPSDDNFPMDGETPYNSGSSANPFDFYETIDFEDFTVKPINSLTIRDDADSKGVTVRDPNNNTGTGKYIIQSNLFTFGKDADFCTRVAENIFKKVKNFSYIPYTATIKGTPYLECGLDAISLRVRDKDKIVPKTFHILERSLSGDQYIKDTVSAKGDEDQKEFISEINLGLSRMRQNDINSNLNNRVRDIEDDRLKAVSVTSVPSNWDRNTIYFIVK